jgi:HlyD family secretion protein
MDSVGLRRVLISGVLLGLAVGGGVYLYVQRPAGLPPGLAAGNGRLESIEVDVATKISGRLSQLLPREGDFVEAGAIVGRIDAADLQAQLRAAEAQAHQARQAVNESRAGVQKSASDATLAGKTLQRSKELVARGFVSSATLDKDVTGVQGARAGLSQAQSRVAEADAAVAAAVAKAESLQVNIDDAALKAPINGRVLYRLAEPGEVLAAGGKALTLLDLTEMYMTIYLPTEKAGQVAVGSAARILLDALPGQPIPATVSFVAAQAQFTPREVETATEREKLMFRLKIKADAAWLTAHRDLAKAGMPGVAYVRLDAGTPWPANVLIDGK